MGRASAPRATAIDIAVRIETDTEDAEGEAGQWETLTLRRVRRQRLPGNLQLLTLETDRGTVEGRLHPAELSDGQTRRAVVWVGGAGGGLNGPAHGLYPSACAELQRVGMTGLRIHYRHPNDLLACALDTMLAAAFLADEGYRRVALVGHSFGGAVVITAGALSGHVTAVVPLSTQTRGAELVAEVSPRPLLLVHGTADEVLPHACSELVYAAAREPKELKLFPGARHGLDEARDEVLALLVDWLKRNT